MSKLILGLMFFALAIHGYAGQYGGEMSVLWDEDQNDGIEQKIDEISRQAKVRQENLDNLSGSLSNKRLAFEKSVIEKESVIQVLPEDYSRLGLKPYYADSKLFFIEPSDLYVEFYSKNGLDSFIYHGEDRASFGYVENGEVSKSWNVNCLRDKITDKKSCVLYKFSFAILYMDGTLSATASDDLNKLDYHQKQYVRVDSNKALSASTLFTGQQFNTLVAQMKKGELARTRFYEWGGERYEETLSLFGFTEAYKYMLYAYKNLK